MAGKDFIPRSKLARFAIALILGGCIEAVCLAIIAAYPPDPPMNLYNAAILLSQMPGMFGSGLFVAALGIPATNEAFFISTFPAQTLVFAAVIYALMLWRTHVA